MSWVKAVLIGFGLLMFSAACGDDEPESSYHCCVAQSLCDLCSCDAPTQGIADSGDDQRCRAYLDSGDWECIGGSEIDARNNCSGQ